MYYRPRIIPCLLIQERGLVKTVKFSKPRYLGDPINAVRIFNGKGVDELCVLDINVSVQNNEPDFEYLKDIATEAFMPLSYGGGITKLSEAERLFFIGYEKIILNNSFVHNPNLVKDISNYSGSQSVVVSLDVKKDLLGRYVVYTKNGKENTNMDPVSLAKKAEEYGAGEILLNSINRDGTMQGYDIKLVKEITDSVNIPVIACGGAKDINDFSDVIENGGAHAAAAGSLFVYYGSKKAVLINYPIEEDLNRIFKNNNMR